MTELYIGNKNYSSWSLRPWLVMKVLGIPFTEKLVPFGSTDFTAFSPSGRVPCLVDGGTVVWDSLAIIEYLADSYAGVWPADAKARAWSRSASAEMHSGFSDLRNICGMNCGVRVALKSRPEGLQRDIARISALWSEGLTRFGGPFLAGKAFTGVDAFFSPVTFRQLTYGLDLGPAGNAYAESIRALAPMRDWYEAGLAEPWRDAPHEEEIRGVGTVTQDLRTTA
jgi:glutathione S-transferase